MPLAPPKPPEPNTHRQTLAELRRRIESALTRTAMVDPAARGRLLAKVDGLFSDAEPVLAESLAASITSGYFAGADHSLSMLPPSLGEPTQPAMGSPPSKPPDVPSLLTPSPDDEPHFDLTSIQEAAERLARRRVMDPSDFYRLAADAKQRAFTITADLTDDSRRKLHNLLVADLDAGTSFTGFQESVMANFDRLPIAPAHLEQVYRNNVNESFSQGMEHVLDHPMVADEFPYRLYVPIHDARARPEHQALEHYGLDGTAVYFKDDPTWLTFRPPWEWSCRCGWIALSIADAARRGVREAIEWQETGMEPAHHWVTPPPFRPPVGWDRTAMEIH